MSASDEEAFESAEEGESKNAETKAPSEKPRQSGESSKSPPKGGSDKGGGKQKGKQQQQQRKAQTKGQVKPAAEKKDRPAQKKLAPEKSKASQSAEAKEDKAKSRKDTKDEKETGAASPAAVPSEPVKPSADKQLAKAEDAESGGNKQGSVTETVCNTETHSDKGTPERVQGKPDQSDTIADSSETQGKSASEIRQSLSSSTEDPKVKKPADQSMLRDSGDSVGESAEERGQQASGSSGSDGGWGWGWGSSLLSAATNSLETFSSQVGEGLTTIMDTVESSFGVPDPQELAQANSAEEAASKTEERETVTVQPQEKEGSEEPHTEKDSTKTQEKTDRGTDGPEKTDRGTDGLEKTDRGTDRQEKKPEGAERVSGDQAQGEEETSRSGGSWLSGWGMSSISSMGKSLVNKSQTLMNTGFEKAETLAAGGLDILETIGKKTYTTLTEHDPGLRRAREFLHMREEKPSLSSVLRDAQERAEEEAKHKEEFEEARKSNFSALFEDNQGLAHLEALEMLSNQSERKVQSLLSAMEEETLEKVRVQLLDIKDIFQKACDSEEDKEQSEESEHEFSKLVTENLSELHLGTAPDKLNQVQETVRQWIADFYSHEDHNEISDAKEVQQRAIQSLADVTSKAVEQFHKAGELVLMQRDEDKSCTHRARSLAKLCSVLVTEVDILANKFSQCLNRIGEEKDCAEDVSPMVTSVFLEASNASGYIQDAFRLLLPVLQHAALQSVL